MSIDTVFRPIGPTSLVVNAAVQVATQNVGGSYMFRVRNLANVAQYFSYADTAAKATALGGATPGAPPGALNTIGMLANSVETFELPIAYFFIASSPTGFEFTPGQGS